MKRVAKVRLVAIILLLITLGACAFFIYYHPPMRLMPSPLLLLNNEGEDEITRTALVDGDKIELFYATNRFPVGPNDNRIYTVAPDTNLHVGVAKLVIDTEDTSIEQLMDWTTGTGGSDRPFVRLMNMSEHAVLDAEINTAAGVWWQELNRALEAIENRSVLIYVHGANTTVERAAGQASQFAHFSDGRAVILLFAWPTAENFLKYPKDIRNALETAPKLAKLIKLVSKNTKAQNITLFSYSAGATLASQSLSRISQNDPKYLDHIGEVYFAAPDADFADFVDDFGLYAGAVDRVTAAVNFGDNALRLAKFVARASRAGRPNHDELSQDAAQMLHKATQQNDLEVVYIDPDVLPESAAASHTFWYDDPWMSSDVLATLLFRLSPSERGLMLGVTDNGNLYWYFPKDFPQRVSRLRAALLEKSQ